MSALAASAVPGTTVSGFCRNNTSTSAAVIRRMRYQDTIDGAFLQTTGCGRGRRRGPQLEKPVGSEIVADRERLRVVPPELFADAVGEPVALLLQVLAHSRPLAQLDDGRILGRQLPEAVSVGAQAVAEDMSIAAVVLGSGDGKPIAEAVELLRVDRVDAKPTFEQRFDNRAVRHLDRDGARRRCRPRHRQQPGTQLGKSRATMGEPTFTDNLAAGIDQTDLVRLACPVDAGEPFDIFCHYSPLCFRRQATATPRHALYWRSWRDSPPDVHRGQPAEARVPVRCSRHGR